MAKTKNTDQTMGTPSSQDEIINNAERISPEDAAFAKLVSEKFAETRKKLNTVIFERNDEMTGLFVTIATGRNMLLLGPPGVAKSFLIDSFANFIKPTDVGNKHISVFKWLLTKYTTPDEIFGPPSIRALKNDEYIRQTEGKLPTAYFAILDEIFKASSGILNTLLTMMNERTFSNGKETAKVPLLALLAASNEIPDPEDGLEALYDRFNLKYTVSPIHEESSRLKMLQSVELLPESIFTIDELQKIQETCKKVAIPTALLKDLLLIHKNLAKKEITISDRTLNIAKSLVKGHALISGRMVADTEDLEILCHAFWRDPEQVREVMNQVLEIANPKKQRIEGLFAQGQKLYDTLAELSSSQSKKTSADDLVQKAIETASKLQNLQTDLQRELRELKKYGAGKTAEIMDLEHKIATVAGWAESVFDLASRGR